MCVKLANCLALQPLTSIGKVCLLKENFEHTIILKNYELLKPIEINVYQVYESLQNHHTIYSNNDLHLSNISLSCYHFFIRYFLKFSVKLLILLKFGHYYIHHRHAPIV